MSLDSAENLNYTVSDTGPARPAPECRIDRRAETVIVFLSFPARGKQYDEVISTLRKRGITVYTNYDKTGENGPAEKTDARLARIREAEVFVFFDDPASRSAIRQIEFGYALGREKAIAFVGNPLNSLHRYGDVFDDPEHFLDTWYSDQYLHSISEWYTPDEERTAKIA